MLPTTCPWIAPLEVFLQRQSRTKLLPEKPQGPHVPAGRAGARGQSTVREVGSWEGDRARGVVANCAIRFGFGLGLGLGIGIGSAPAPAYGLGLSSRHVIALTRSKSASTSSAPSLSIVPAPTNNRICTSTSFADPYAMRK